MTRFITTRIIKALITVWFILTLVFMITRLSGDPTQWLLPDDATATVREQLRISLGLDKPLFSQYVQYLSSLFTGDMGKSYHYLRPVGELFAERAGPTIALGTISFGLAILIGVPIGVFAAVNRNSILDRITMGISIAGYTIPNFVFAILLIFLFSLKLRLLPSGGLSSPLHYIMPLLALTVDSVAGIARLTRGSMLDVLRQDYLDSARAKGVRERMVIYKHALRNALIPVVTIIGLHLGTLIGGAVVVETVFAFPGIGMLIVQAAQYRDFPVIQYGVMLVSTTVILVNLLVDLSYGFLDPRIRDNF
ncbi:ABC transporter permease [Paenibacillus sp. CGMCC 1.16610]|uniref:ABC transporter permease subunit n=1 Tax=Paenibacillus anseongense TaxID=2682845 RepID=A0ABW9U5S6_9BACL|nr:MULTISPECIES: ABC transporter permease [Paenibacillus]MBA2940277.1 ABC transporter permease [Paenibacillus sp. CGMCC 1.16610]MVQ35454.1 ABC transporter permease subunit [Paenibacillus anseongense]